MTRHFAPSGVLDNRAIAYYRRRAADGIGLILTEGVAPNLMGSPANDIPLFFGEDALAIWPQIVAGVHAEGGKIMPQLWHTGIRRKQEAAANKDDPSQGPSDTYPELYPERAATPGRAATGRAMTQADIDHTIDSYATAAKTAQSLGFDGVELHGAHGYLLDQFFWAESNRRSDDYGGSMANRQRLCVEIVREMRRRVGPAFPIGLRFSQWKLPDFYSVSMLRNPQELEEFLTPLIDAGVDFLDPSTRRYWEPAFEGSPLTLAAWTKKISGLTTTIVGSVGLAKPLAGDVHSTKIDIENNLGALYDMLAREEVDLVMVGRALLGDPLWLTKVRTGRFDDIVRYDSASLRELV
jgi:2,4-dienoyl-CoA reductase-like NADH-dependent reductase (Old Yellow Enzyme family)